MIDGRELVLIELNAMEDKPKRAKLDVAVGADGEVDLKRV